MFKKLNFKDFRSQANQMFQIMSETLPFIRKNKLWAGFFQYRWLTIFSVVIAFLFSWCLMDDIENLFFWRNLDVLTAFEGSNEMGIISNEVKEEGKDALFSGSTKYMLLILLEIIIFYFSVRTLAVLSGQPRVPTGKDFLKAEKRMIKIIAWNFAKGLIVQVLLQIILSILGYNEWTSFFMFFVYAYFIGYAFMDNYNEQFGMKITESQTIIRQHLGATFTLGMGGTLLMYIPLIGPFLVPILGGVAATLYGFRFIKLQKS